ncbi:RecB family exonuclease [Corynebacterium aquilae]|uniref:Exodeoxyribonuclease V subunit beta n=1 Tax=Corynebacterium aquilae DSM 44791 TaxID=1431546 RepID=A0A1L7CG03_9CORY|nr:RecB family exonuclease [Corynebacterium aquilae]APT84755.1 exodeoxyribonuclease V subunit beta [Corynebacterium aquilae DSM 44791]
MNAPKPLALSPSRASDYQQCPLLYRFRAIDRLPEPTTYAQITGTLVHAVLENLHQLPTPERTYPAAVKMIKPEWEKAVTKDPTLRGVIGDTPDKELDFFVTCRSLVRGYFEMENPQGFSAEKCEMYVNTTLPNGVPVRGFIDRVDVAPTGQVRVVDYKTGKKPLPRYAAAARFQMRFYALVYWRMFNIIPDQLRLMYLKVSDSLILTPSQEELEYFEKDLGHLWSNIEADGKSGNFRPKTSKLCGWCAHQDLCPEFGGTPPEYPGWPGSVAEPVESDPATQLPF